MDDKGIIDKMLMIGGKKVSCESMFIILICGFVHRYLDSNAGTFSLNMTSLHLSYEKHFVIYRYFMRIIL